MDAEKEAIERLKEADRKFRELCHEHGVDPKTEGFPPSDKMKAVIKALYSSLDNRDEWCVFK